MVHALLIAAWATLVARAGEVPYLHDPILYPPEVASDDPLGSGQIRLEDGTSALVLEHTSVVAEVSAGLARVTLVQWFRNPFEDPIDATYLFPLPAGTAVDHMDLTCGDRLVEGVVMDRQQARDAYDAARRDGRKAALLEQQRDNLFTQHLANLCPREEVQVTLQYVEQVSYEDGVYALSFPMTVGPRFSPPWVTDAAALDTPYARTGRDVDFTVYIDEGVPVESLWSDTHDVDVTAEDERGATVELSAEDTIPNRDFELSWSLAGDRPRVGVVSTRPRPEEPGYLAVTIEPQVIDDLFEPRPRELVFVVDSSGSMAGEPYEVARAAVLLALDEMDEGDTFNLVRFSDQAGALFALPQPATEQARALAREWLAVFDGGGTMMESGIVAALDMQGDPEAMRLVLMLTDGWIGGEDTVFATVRDHLRGARLFSLGVSDNPNRYLLEGLAEMGRGDVSYHLPGTPIAESVDTFYERIARPAMSDVRIDWGTLSVTEQYPKRIPDLWAGQPVRVVARFQGDAPTTVTVSGRVGREVYEVALPFDVAAGAAHEAVATLWARRKIRDIEWYPRGRSEAAVKAAVTAVALRHHLVSRYTSLVAIDDQPGTCGPASFTVEVPQEVPSGQRLVGGLGIGGSGLGGGGSAMGLGGLGTKGTGYGGGSFASRPEGGIASVGGDPIILGSPDRSVVDEVVKRHLNQIRYAYEVALRADASLSGKVVVKFVIAADGTVASAEIKSSTLGHPEVEARLLGIFGRMTFPAPVGGGILVVSYPFVFSGGE